MPSEKQCQHYQRQGQPYWQPDQRATERFFGVASVAQGAQEKSKEQADEAVAEVKCHTLEREDRGTSARLHQSVEIIREKKADGGHGGTERESEYHAPPSPAQCQSRESRQGNNREPEEIPSWRTSLDHAPRDRRNKETERSEAGPDQTVTGGREFDQPEIRAGEGQKQSDRGIEQEAGQNHEECQRRVQDPLSRGQHPLERSLLSGRGSVVGHRDFGERFPTFFPHTEGDDERKNGGDQVEINWKTQRGVLRESAGVSDRASDCVHKPGIIDCAADKHGYHEADRLPSGDLVEHLRPFRGSTALGERVEHQRFVRTAGQTLRDAAEQSVCQTKKKEQRASADWSDAKDRHFDHHRDRRGDNERPPSDPICERAGREVRADDGNCPGEIQQGVLGCAEAEIEKKHCQNRVIKPRVKEHAEEDKASPITIGSVEGFVSRHASCPTVAAFVAVAIGYRDSLVAVTAVILAAMLLFTGVARSQEPTPLSKPTRPRLVVGLVESPPFCIRGENGSWSGISVELWEWIAADLEVDTEFRETTLTGLFDDLAPGRPLDVSIGALTITPEREDRLDFSESFFLSGLAVAIKTTPATGGVLSWLGRLLVWNFWRIVAALLASLVLVALLIWVLEHKGNPQEFGGHGKAHRGIGSALWWSAVTMTTVGYGDLAPRSLPGRLVAIAWMFVSLFLVSWFTASMASILTAERLDVATSGLIVRGPDDLRRLHVAVIAGTSSEDYLRHRQIDYIRVPPKELIEVLLTGRAQAILGDAPTLRYVARSARYEGKITVLPQTFQAEPYGIALRDGSPWRKPVDRALLHRLANPAWGDLIYRYLGMGNTD
jgi:polar amino acid transport system substrate-binding protein